MAEFIDVLGGDGTWHFINLQQITKVTCKVEHKKHPAGFEISSILDSTVPQMSPASEETIVTIRIFTASGDGHVIFSSEEEADAWAGAYLNIRDFILRSQTLER